LLSLTHVFQRQARRMTHIFNDGGSRSVTRVCECTCLQVKAEIDHLPSVTNDNLGGVLVGHNNGRGRQTGAMGQWGVRLKGLPGHTSVQVGAHLEHVTRYNVFVRDFAFKVRFLGTYVARKTPFCECSLCFCYTYAAKEVVSELLSAAMLIGLGLGLLKATQTACPLFINTPEQEVTRAFLKLASVLSHLLAWRSLAFCMF